MVPFQYLHRSPLRRIKMAPIRTYSKWNVRPDNNKEQIEPYRHYYFICEGANTEKWYFEKLIDLRKDLSIRSQIDIVYLEKTDEHANLSDPEKLIEFADSKKDSGDISFDKKFDKMIVVFDADVFEKEKDGYDKVIEKGLRRNILGVTNPSFELFLLLHYHNSYNEIILPNTADIIKNEWVGVGSSRRRFIEDLFRKKAGIRPKSNSMVGELAKDVLVAIEQEKKLNNDIKSAKGVITSNIGQIIASIIEDQCNNC